MICPKCRSTKVKEVMKYPRLARVLSMGFGTKGPRTPYRCLDCNYPFFN